MRNACFAVAAVLIGAPSFVDASQEGATTGSVVQTREDTAAKEELAARILEAAEQRGGRGWSERARANAKGALLSRTLKDLEDARAEGGDRALEILMGARDLVSNLIGANQHDWVFTPVASCRILDTRPGSGQQGAGTGPYAAGTVHSIFVIDQNPPSCGIPPVAKAAVLNFVAAGASGNGNLRVWPWDSNAPPAPGTAVLNFTSGFNTSNYTVMPFCNTATATAGTCFGGDLFIEPFASATHVIVDTVGYFAAPVLRPIAVALVVTPGSTTSTTFTEIEGIGTDFTTLGGLALTRGRLVALWEGQSPTPACTVASIGHARFKDLTTDTVLATIDRPCQFRAALDVSAEFTLPSGSHNYGLEVSADNAATATWRSFTLELYP